MTNELFVYDVVIDYGTIQTPTIVHTRIALPFKWAYGLPATKGHLAHAIKSFANLHMIPGRSSNVRGIRIVSIKFEATITSLADPQTMIDGVYFERDAIVVPYSAIVVPYSDIESILSEVDTTGKESNNPFIYIVSVDYYEGLMEYIISTTKEINSDWLNTKPYCTVLHAMVAQSLSLSSGYNHMSIERSYVTPVDLTALNDFYVKNTKKEASKA